MFDPSATQKITLKLILKVVNRASAERVPLVWRTHPAGGLHLYVDSSHPYVHSYGV